MESSQKCIDLIKLFEGFSSTPYPDPGTGALPYTIGYGSTHYSDGTLVTLNDTPITSQLAEKLLQITLDSIAKTLDYLVIVDLSQNQVDALLSLIYNIGTQAFKHSTLLKLLNTGDVDKAAEQILVWNRSNGKVLPGLVKRRQAEHDLFLS